MLGLFVGLAGGSFAVGIAYTSAWFEKERQGTAMGIFGAGNAGAAIPPGGADDRGRLRLAHGAAGLLGGHAGHRRAVLAVHLDRSGAPQGAVEASQRPTLAKQLAPLAELRVWRFGLYYFFVFGGFVALCGCRSTTSPAAWT